MPEHSELPGGARKGNRFAIDDTTVTETTQAEADQQQATPTADAEAAEAGQETTGGTSTGQGEDALSLEDATKALRKARAEAAKYRTQRNELQEAAGEAEAMRARLAELEAERDKAVTEAVEATRAAIGAGPRLPDVDAVGRQARDDKDTIARQVLGIT